LCGLRDVEQLTRLGIAADLKEATKDRRMSRSFEELDWRLTPIGTLSLRRRKDLSTGIDIFEIKLGDEFLMSSLFTAAEVELARLGLAATPDAELDVVVGGLGLGYTACAVLDDPRVRSLVVIDALPEVIEWHERGLLPLGARLTADPRCRLICGDFFATFGPSAQPLEAAFPDRRFHAILVDIDHSPREVLAPANAALYAPAGLRQLTSHLLPEGVFALWSNAPPDEEFVAALSDVFPTVQSHVIHFPNPLQSREATNTVYVATTT
jgi:spermidine synthase